LLATKIALNTIINTTRVADDVMNSFLHARLLNKSISFSCPFRHGQTERNINHTVIIINCFNETFKEMRERNIKIFSLLSGSADFMEKHAQGDRKMTLGYTEAKKIFLKNFTKAQMLCQIKNQFNNVATAVTNIH
jgi:hypothetical protein